MSSKVSRARTPQVAAYGQTSPMSISLLATMAAMTSTTLPGAIAVARSGDGVPAGVYRDRAG